MNYWLMKSEPHVYPWEMLVKDKKTHWDGVRNYQARNMMRDEMKLGDLVFFYHSNFKPPHVAVQGDLENIDGKWTISSSSILTGCPSKYSAE